MPTWPPTTRIGADAARSGNAGLRRDHDIASHVHVVAEVDQIVDLHAALDAGFFQSAAIDGRVGADLDVIFNHEPPLLRELEIFAAVGVAHIAKAVGSKYHAGVNDDVLAQFGARINNDARINAAMGADFDASSNHRTGANPGSGANLRMRLNHHARTHRDMLAERRGGIDDRSGMYAAVRFRRSEESSSPGKR